MPTMTAAEIDWSLDPAPRFERFPSQLLAALSHDDLLAFAEDRQDDLAAIRVTLHETLQAFAHVTAECHRLRLAMRRARE